MRTSDLDAYHAENPKRTLSDTIQRVKSIASDDTVTLGDIIDRVGDTSILPAILLPALIAATPLSGIPGVSVVCGLLIALLSFELIFRFRHLYLPRKLRRFSLSGRKLRHALGKITPAVSWIDDHTRHRLSFLFHRPLIWVPQIICLLSGMAMPFLEFIPFSSSVAAIGVCFLVMAMLTRDGIFAILALIPYSGILYLLSRVFA